jgi:hypothetical protein
MYSKIKVKSAHKIFAKDVFTNEKETIQLNAGEILVGRIDQINGNSWLTLEDGRGAVVDKGLFEVLN